MSIALIIPDRKLDDLQQRLQQALPTTPIEIWPDIAKPEHVTFAVVWKQPTGSVASLPNLKALQSFGAGVDGILSDASLPRLPLARIVDPALTEAMLSYLAGIEAYYRLRLDLFQQQQQQALWRPKSPRRLSSLCVLGLGELGTATALHFKAQGYQVNGWSRRPQQLAGVHCFAGTEQLAAAVGSADLLICLLPLTAQTENLLNADFFAMLKPGAILINVARGAIVDEQALLAALDSGQLAAACLDVFRQEPLVAEHAFWRHPAIMITPHISAVTKVETVVAQIAENYQRSCQGQSLVNEVDLQQGY
ncbi:glyoxylate/hydroxypyruvate reductase A [Alishewanella sp. SMS8]|uniref:2-hydroxyacid dehydrogenase n=1 Tax=unclassified Alishewanella TaxID=2628974 RepID=UPI0027418958|nr:glyoxylate/hydroxypyruvate reductase A [Alishewanella sp. SMS8]MDP4946152.1 glyoxylate/hydroxypyruvate reductase A [Alishewanella sp.]MDP5036495.1 glyoxylate/hydroxypyruvate reductase A [Alishewanella sp.]MDP5186723.1 glyoxylate/hydroxypyruvate reductase A [Alishewanella sp.]MDP5459444.1 glyoxylate/hydroxypyruvate reductase A [Alishewanella sp. SMS8]